MAVDFLGQIVEYKKEEIRKQRLKRSEQSLRADAETMQNRRPFMKKLESGQPGDVHIVAEIKRASPSKGDIRPGLDPSGLAAAYEHGGASAISVLTEEKWFKGSIEDLQKARDATTLPVLRKDFIVSSYQIYESALIPADAVLLIVRILSRNQLNEYLSLCAALGLDTLVEIHTPGDIETIRHTAAKLIGINNRNLKTFETSTDTAIGLAKRLNPDQIPVAASGIASRKDIEENLKAGIYHFLIGESLATATHPDRFIKHLRGETATIT